VLMKELGLLPPPKKKADTTAAEIQQLRAQRKRKTYVRRRLARGLPWARWGGVGQQALLSGTKRKSSRRRWG